MLLSRKPVEQFSLQVKWIVMLVFTDKLKWRAKNVILAFLAELVSSNVLCYLNPITSAITGPFSPVPMQKDAQNLAIHFVKTTALAEC